MTRFLLILALSLLPTTAEAVQWLKQSTAATVKVGPFVDDSDGVTAETGLTVSQADIRLSKNGGAFAQTNNATGATHDENGYYGVPLDTTDTGTLGTLKVAVAESGALPVWQEFMVVPANVYDSLVGGSDYIQTDLTQVEGTAASTSLATAENIVDEWESQSQADPTGFHVNLLEIGGTAQTANDNGADINAILTDTATLPTASPGASGGLLIAGTNAATTFNAGLTISNASGTALTLSSTGGNGHALLATGNGTGEGFSLVGGATGNGLQAYGGSTSGSGIVGGTQGTGHGMELLVGGGANGNGLYVLGSGAGHGISIAGGATGNAFTLAGGSTSGDGIKITTTSGDGIDVSGGFAIAGGATIANSGGTALTLTSSGSNGSGLIATGNGTGHGISAVAGGSVGSVGLRAANTNGYGLEAYSSDNDGAIFNTGGENTDGLVLTGDSGGADLRLTNATGSDLGTAIDTIDTTVDSVLVDTGTTIPATLATLSAGNFWETTVASVTTTTQIVLTAGPDFDDALNNQVIVLTDATNNDYPSVRIVTDYEGSTKTATLNTAADFTVAAADGVTLWATSQRIDAAISTVESTTQPRVNYTPAWSLRVSNRNDGSREAVGRVRVAPGTFDIETVVGLDVAPLFGETVQVLTVGTPTVSSGTSITATALGPRDEPGKQYAMVQLDGTATAGEVVTVDVPVTMASGDKALCRFTIEVLDE